MTEQEQSTTSPMARDLTQAMLRLVLALGLFWICARIFSPFATIMLWALILAVTLYPLQLKIQASLGWREGFIAAVIVLLGLLLLGIPLALLAISFVEQASVLVSQWQEGKPFISEPNESVKTWPLIGEQLHELWLAASNNLESLLVEHSAQVIAVAKGALGGTASFLSTTGIFLGALVIAGFMMAYGKSGQEALRRIAITLAGGPRGAQLQTLSVATMRSVATGVIGVAAIQALQTPSVIFTHFLVINAVAAQMSGDDAVVQCLPANGSIHHLEIAGTGWRWASRGEMLKSVVN